MCESVVNPNVEDRGHVTWWIQDLLIVQNYCPSSVFAFSNPSVLINPLAQWRKFRLVKSIFLVVKSMFQVCLVKLTPNDFRSSNGAWPSDSCGTAVNSPKRVWRCGPASILISQLWKLGFGNFPKLLFCAHHLLDTDLFFFMFLVDLLGGFAQMCNNALGLHGLSIFHHMNCWTNFVSSWADTRKDQ